MIEPQVSLAFALHSNPGAYAMLIGSGVSVGAGIPTGWQMVLDLISKVARVLGEDPGDDLAGWYQERYGEEPDYSKLLDALAKSPAERSALLRSYFEPTAEERARGVKVPGAAHTALAKLAVTGHVRLFVTTNFDRLIEQALEAAGVTPRVLSTPDSILGSPPLSQAGCTVLKLHGDYLDTRIKNTPAELDAYDESVDALLDRVIDEHGFIICGWSATWDTALRRAFERSKSRRYTTYWAAVRPPGEHASRLIELVHGEFVQVKGADAFFTEMVDKLESLGDPGGAQVESRATAPRAQHNLPVQLTSFIGREDEIAEINSLLSDAPLVTLTGSGGAGKTRLAQEIGSANVSVYADGVWSVGLAPLSDPPGLIAEEVASVLGVGEEALYDYLEDKSILLILDNCEHMIDGCAEFASTLLQRAPQVKVLATSQEALGIPGETVHRVPSLLVPDSPQLPVEALTKCAAVRLFVERAATAQPGFTLTDKNAVAVAQITQSLDGIPLAIELAAARVNMLSAEQIAERLEDSLRLLTRGVRTAVPRHQTLRGAVQWSYDLLSDAESLLFNRLSVFRGGFTLEAAEEVCSGDGLESYEVLDVLSQLVDKSLVVAEEGEARYRLLTALRLYGAERLAGTGEAEDVRSRHAAFFLRVAEMAAPELTTAKQVTWLARLESDYDNFRTALAWALESDQGETALRIAPALFWFWLFHRHIDEGQDWLERAVLHGGDSSPTVRAIGLARAAALHANKLKDFERPNRWLEESLRLCQEAGWTEGKAEVLYLKGIVAWFEGKFESMSKDFEDVRSLLEGAKHTPMINTLMNTISWFQGSSAALRGDIQHATALFEQSLDWSRKGVGHFNLAYTLVTMGGRSLDKGDYEGAASHYRESLPLFRDYNDLTGVACALAGLGNVAWLQGDHEQALRLHQESLANFRDSREGSTIAVGLTCLAGGGYPPDGLQRLVERHNERLDLPPEEWSKEVIAEAVHRSGTAV